MLRCTRRFLDATALEAAFSALERLRRREDAAAGEAPEPNRAGATDGEKQRRAAATLEPPSGRAGETFTDPDGNFSVYRDVAGDDELYVAPSSWPPRYRAYQLSRRAPTRQGLVVMVSIPGYLDSRTPSFSALARPQTALPSLSSDVDAADSPLSPPSDASPSTSSSSSALSGPAAARNAGSIGASFGLLLDQHCPEHTVYAFRLWDLNQGIPHRRFHPRRTIKVFTSVRFALAPAEAPVRMLPPAVAGPRFRRWRVSTTHLAVDICREDGRPLPLGPPLLEQVHSNTAGGGPRGRARGRLGGSGGGVSDGLGLSLSGSGLSASSSSFSSSSGIGGGEGGGTGGGVGLGKFRRDLLSGDSGALQSSELDDLCSGTLRRFDP